MTRDLRLAPTALSAWVAAWILTGIEVSNAVVLGGAALGAAALLLAGLLVGSRATLGAHLLLVAVCLVALAGSVHVQSAARAPLTDLAADAATATLSGTVVSEPRPATFGDGYRWKLATTQVWARGAGSTARGHVEITAPGPPPYGATVVVRARLGPPGIGAGDVAAGTATEVTVTAEPGAVLRATTTLRTALLEVTDPLSPQARGLVPGTAVGDTTRLPDDLDHAMKVTSLTHVTAVSGSHFVIVVTVLTACCVALRLPRGVRVALLLTGAVGFVLLVRPEPSVLRAGWTCAVALLALTLGRPAAGVSSLAVASTVLLVVDPWMARSFGFALSCAATAGIVVLTGPLARRMTPWCGRALGFALAVPLAAQLACGPLLILLDPALPATSVPANLLAAPALVPATVLGLVATLLAPWAPALAGAVAWVAGLATAWLAGVARFFAALPGARLPWLDGPGGAVLLAVATAVAVWLVLRRPVGRGWRRDPEEALGDVVRRVVRAVALAPGRLLIGAGCVLVLVVAAVLLAPRVGVPARGIPADWQVVACDVGQGDTLVVRSGPRAAVVVDVGPPGTAAAGCLRRLGVDRVDLLVLSHFHTDHVGGLEAVLAATPVDAAVVSPLVEPVAPARRALEALADADVAVVAGATGHHGVAGTVAWQVLAAQAETGHANDASVVLALRTADGVDVVALGDLEQAGQEALLGQLRGTGFPTGRVEVVKMAHHGSASQSAGLAELLVPQVTLVPVGENGYGHPTDAALEMYSGSRIVRTDECGTSVLVVRGGELALACV